MGRGTGVAGATPEVPVGEPVVEEANADETPRGTDVVGATEGEPVVESDPQLSGQRQEQAQSATPVVGEQDENSEAIPATSARAAEEVESSAESGTDSPDTPER
eukprot:4603185-Prorocentrum_lima.AAC.1